MTEESVRSEAAKLHEAACDLFGLWGIALHYAGVDHPFGHTAQTVIREIRHYQGRLSSLAQAQIERQDPSLLAAAIRYYGSWDAVLTASGINPRNVLHYPPSDRPSRQQVLGIIAERSKRGRSLQRFDVSCEDYRFVCRARNLFGSWVKALEAAGVITRTPNGRPS